MSRYDNNHNSICKCLKFRKCCSGGKNMEQMKLNSFLFCSTMCNWHPLRQVNEIHEPQVPLL